MEIFVNTSQWNDLSDKDRNKIQAIIRSYFPDASIYGSVSAESAENILGQQRPSTFDLKKPICTAACTVAEAAAVATCSVLVNPLAIALCAAAAHEAGNYCRSQCQDEVANTVEEGSSKPK